MNDLDERFIKGLHEFNNRNFFDCHDTWEGLWMETRGPDRLFLHGLIQIAVAYYHVLNGNFSGGFNLFTKGIQKLQSYPPSHHGIDLAAFRTRLELHRTMCREYLLGAGERPDECEIPTLQIQS